MDELSGSSVQSEKMHTKIRVGTRQVVLYGRVPDMIVLLSHELISSCGTSWSMNENKSFHASLKQRSFVPVRAPTTTSIAVCQQGSVSQESSTLPDLLPGHWLCLQGCCARQRVSCNRSPCPRRHPPRAYPAQAGTVYRINAVSHFQRRTAYLETMATAATRDYQPFDPRDTVYQE